MNADRMMMGDDDYSRRSSLRSTSIYDYEGQPDAGTYLFKIMIFQYKLLYLFLVTAHTYVLQFLGHPDSPGPEKTKNPWESEAGSRRSSITAKPEVLVTGSEEPGKSQSGEGAGKTSAPRLMSLLPVSICSV